MDHGTTKRFGIPISHLDYRFIETCTDVKHLQKILHILRSGEEGKYPDLTAFCERQIEKHAPRSRALRKDKPPATAADFSWEEWRDIDSDFKDWLTNIKLKDQQQSSLPSNADCLPPVRAYTCSSIKKPEGKEDNVKKCKIPRNYSEWDRFDVDKEISKIEESSEEKVQSKPVLNPSISELKKTVDTAGLSQVQISFTANREKEKGNEAFRSGDYEEAVSYYTRSISILPTVAAYNNRAQAEIKLKNWQNALNDCERVLALEAGNVKALIRRATVHKNLRNYQAAVSDLKTALLREPGNPTAKRVLAELERLIEKAGGETMQKGVRIQIEDIESSDQEDANLPTSKREAGVTGEGEADMGNAQKKQSPSRSGPGGGEPTRETPRPPPRPSKDKGAHNGLVSNGQEEKRDPERQSRGQDPNHNTEPSLPRLSPTARLKAEGNQLFKNGQFGEAAATYSQAISQLQGSENAEELGILYSNRAACQLKEGNSRECIEDCNRALCYLKLCQYEEARRDCESALQRDASNIKALYRRAQANKGLEVSDDEEPSSGGSQNKLSETLATTKPLMTKPSNTYEFGQRINEVKATKDTEACAELLAAIDPKDLPVFLSNTLEGDTLLMIVQSLKCGVLLHNPTLVYQHLSHLTTAERFQVALMFLDQEKAEIHSLFTSLSENPPEGVESGDILDLVKEYGL
uniref:Sperm associated antigen 1 n=1 Tax=Leptobrachium leishanense TaxID=445787 RepID=A0A8C5Q2U0_9ANUR